jgi:hypothetical protein
MISQEMIRSILARYALAWEGIHGVPHWARVLENGRRLSEITGAKAHVVAFQKACITTEPHLPARSLFGEGREGTEKEFFLWRAEGSREPEEVTPKKKHSAFSKHRSNHGPDVLGCRPD